MEFLLPNEIARLVYGYLEEEGCVSAAKSFLETSSHLKECMHNAVKGRRFNTKVLGLGLVEMLDQLAEVTCYVRSIEKEARKNKISLGEILTQLKLTLKLGSTEETVEKPVYLRITMPPHSKRKTKSSEHKVAHDSSVVPGAVHESSALLLENPPESPVVPNQSHALQVLLEKKALHEKLAENINKVVANKSDAESLERILEKKIVETIVNTTEKDPIFQEMLDELVGPIEATNSTPEDTEIENEEASGKQQSGVGVAQQISSGSSNIVSTSIGSLVIPSGTVPVTSDQALHASVSPATGYLPHQVPPLVNALPYQPAVSPSVGFGLQTVPRTPVQSSLFSQGAPSDSYVVTSAPGKVTLNRTMPPVPGGVSSCPSLPGSTVPSVVPATPSRYRTIRPMPPVKSSIRVLHPATQQLMTPNDVMNVPPSQGSVLQGLLGKASVDVEKTSLKVISPAAPLLDSTPLKRQVSQTGSTPAVMNPLIRVCGVRTRGGKARTLKTYCGAKNDKKPPKQFIPILSKPREVTNSVDTQVPLPSSPDISTPIPSEKLAPVITTVSARSINMEPGPENNPNQRGIAEPFRELPTDIGNTDVKSVDKEEAELNKLKSEVGNITSSAAGMPSAPERPDATPQQGSEPKVKLRKRLSLSTPRKGSHVRTLEFKTPPKGSSMPRKSLSSPKNKAPDRLPHIHKMLQSVKKSELFKSPPKKEETSWDAHLRVAVNDPCEDIPTSVGLKRRVPDQARNQGKSSPSKVDALAKLESSPKTPESTGKSETDEDLVTRIQRDVLDVIDEEDLGDVNINNKSTDSVESSKTKSPVKSPSTGSILEIGDIGVPSSTIKKLYPKRIPSGEENSSTWDSPISKAQKDLLFMSPQRSQEPELGVTTSSTGKTPEGSLPNTPGSASLEATLIRECSRIESEGMERARIGSIFGLHKDFTFGEKSIESSSPEKGSEESADPGTSCLPVPKGILVLKTPAKSTSSVPVEMTPLSKIINEETRLGKCTLLTPTIPPTPNYEELKNQDPSKIVENSSPPSDRSVKESPKVLKKSLKTPTKTPHVRLKTKDLKLQASKTKGTKKKKKTTAIDCNQLIAQCLQSVKESVYGDLLPDTEDDSSQFISLTKKKSPPVHKKSAPKKKKLPEKKKIKVDDETKKTEEPAKDSIVVPSFAEMIERYESINDPGLSSSDDSEVAASKSNTAESQSVDESQKNITQPENAGESKSVGEDSVVVSNDSDVAVQSIKLVETEQPAGISDGSKVYEIKSPESSPIHPFHDSVLNLPTEKVDLDLYTMNCAWITDGGTVNTVLSTTPFLHLYSYPPANELSKPKPQIEANKSADSNHGSRGDMYEQSRRRRRSESGSCDEDEQRRRRRRSESGSGHEGEPKDRKRKRLEKTYDSTTPRSPRRRGRGRGRPMRGRGSRGRMRTPLPEFRDWHMDRREPRRRSCPDCDDPHSPDRSRPGKRREEMFPAGRKDRSRERERSPTCEPRRGARSPRETQFRKSSRQEIKAERARQEIKAERSRQEIKAERARQEATSKRVRQEGNTTQVWGDLKVERAWLESKAERLKHEGSTQWAQFHVPPGSHPPKRNPLPPPQGKFKFERPQEPHELEEGEISDTSRSTILSFSKTTSHFSGTSAARLSSPVADENRQALLQRVDLDQFLSLVHGEDKSSTL